MDDIAKLLEHQAETLDHIRGPMGKSPIGAILRNAAAEITRLRAIEAALLEPTDAVVEIVAEAIWATNPGEYKGRARAAIKALATAVLNDGKGRSANGKI